MERVREEVQGMLNTSSGLSVGEQIMAIALAEQADAMHRLADVMEAVIQGDPRHGTGIVVVNNG